MVANAHPELREWCEAHASENIFPVRTHTRPQTHQQHQPADSRSLVD